MPPGAAGDTSVASPVLIDAHTHLWELFDPERVLDAAARNLELAQRDLGIETPPSRVLLLMETSDDGFVQRSRDLRSAGAWRFEPTGETGSVLAVPDSESAAAALLLIEGRQVVTAEGLELLATPCATGLPSGLSMPETIAAAHQARAIPILPWGFGKWWGARGRVVASVLESHRANELLIADNGGRPRFGWKPRLLTLAAQRGFRVLRGSDPLPVAGELERVGSFGSLVWGEIDWRQPAAGLHRLLRRLVTQPRGFGGGIGLPGFLSSQIRLRLRRRSG